MNKLNRGQAAWIRRLVRPIPFYKHIGVLKTQGKILHKGKRVAVGDAEARDEHGRLISKGSATYMILGNSRQRILDVS